MASRILAPDGGRTGAEAAIRVMIDDCDVWQAAVLMVKHYGSDAMFRRLHAPIGC